MRGVRASGIYTSSEPLVYTTPLRKTKNINLTRHRLTDTCVVAD